MTTIMAGIPWRSGAIVDSGTKLWTTLRRGQQTRAGTSGGTTASTVCLDQTAVALIDEGQHATAMSLCIRGAAAAEAGAEV